MINLSIFGKIVINRKKRGDFMIYTTYKKIDDLGRLVVPKDIRESIGISLNEVVRIDVENERVIITKAEDTCVFCGGTENLLRFMSKTVCKNCARALGR